jgi:hypothetical protein
MSRQAVVMMVVGMAIIWGGLAAAIVNAVLHTRRHRDPGA